MMIVEWHAGVVKIGWRKGGIRYSAAFRSKGEALDWAFTHGLRKWWWED